MLESCWQWRENKLVLGNQHQNKGAEGEDLAQCWRYGRQEDGALLVRHVVAPTELGKAPGQLYVGLHEAKSARVQAQNSLPSVHPEKWSLQSQGPCTRRSTEVSPVVTREEQAIKAFSQEVAR